MAELTPQQRLVARITCAQRQIYGYILTLLADPAAAEDVLQETNLVLVEKADQWDAAEDFVAWACRVAYFQTLAHFKRRRRDRLAFMDETALSDIAGRTAAAIQHHDRRLTAMRQCLGKLPEASRRLIALRYDGQFSIDQIAAETARSGGAIRVALHRARQMLLDCIRKTLAADS